MQPLERSNHWQLFVTLAIAGATAWAYAFAFLFEYGYLFHFGVPTGFIQIRYVNIIVAILAVGGAALPLLSYGFLGLQNFAKRKPFTRLKAMCMSCITIFLLLVIIPVLMMQYYIAKLTLPALIFFGAIGLCRLWRTEGKTWEEKLKNMEEKELYFDKIFLFLESIFGFKTVLAGGLILFSLCLAFFVGGTWATIKETFPILKYDDQEYAVVRIYEENVIALPLVRRTKELTHEVYVFDVKEISSTGRGFTIEEIGRLQTEKIANTTF